MPAKKTPMIFAAVILLFLVASCARITGTFALKYPMDDSYRRVKDAVEIDRNTKVQWVFQLDKIPSKKTTIGVILLKKELVWVDILTQSATVAPDNAVVYGSIQDLEEGQYKIMLTDVAAGSEISELEFTVFSDREEEIE